MGHTYTMKDKEYRIEYIDGPGEGYYIIVIGDWEDQITNDDNYDPFETEESAERYAKENLQ